MSLSPSTEPIKLPPMLGLPADFTVPDVIPLTTPSVPVPSIINTERALERAAESLRAASGPVAVDTERAQGIRYGIRAFLVQLKREDKLYLIDPEASSSRCRMDYSRGNPGFSKSGSSWNATASSL